MANAGYVWQVTGRNAGAVNTASSATRIFTVAVAPPAPKTLTVTKTGDTAAGACTITDCSLREAIGSGASGDKIEVPAGTYTLSLGTELVIDTSLTLTGDGPGATIIQAAISSGSATSRVLQVMGGEVAISGVTIRHGNPSGDGGGIWNKGTLSLNNSHIYANSADFGGGVFNISATLIMTDSLVIGNSADNGGGIFNNVGGILTITNSTIRDNVSPFGAGIGNFHMLTMTDSTVAGNVARFNGGGISSSIFDAIGNVSLINTTVRDNSAARGGGIFHFGPLIVTGGTISGNMASLEGGGIYALGPASLTNSTVSGNSAVFTGGGIRSGFTVTNSIVAGNTAPTQPDCETLVSSGHNLIGDTSGCAFTPITGDLLNVDPLLGPLQDNGGPTFTHALLSGSPAIDHIPVGDCSVTTDQRGTARPKGGGCDIGAFESDPTIVDLIRHPSSGASAGRQCDLRHHSLLQGLSAVAGPISPGWFSRPPVTTFDMPFRT